MMRIVSMLVCVGVLIGGTARAAEPGGIFNEEPDPMYERAERADPFTLGEPKPEVVPEIFPPDPPDPLEIADPGAVAKILSTSREDRFERCLAECARQIELLTAAVSYLERYPEKEGAGKLGECAGRLEGFRRLEATARRLKERREIQAEFAGFKLRVQGIVCHRGRASTAVLAGQLVTEGSLLKPAGAEEQVRVRRIEPRSVVCVYRGLEVEVGF
jgi:hypothetical protein